MKPVLLVFGPTASGKTSLALGLARRFNGEIVSADSMQIYRKMDIGTAKATPEERAEIPHHCIDLCDLGTAFSTPQYREAALSAIRDIHARGKLPIVAGGTGLYFDSILTVPSYGETATNPALRAALQARALAEGCEAMHEELCRIDAQAAARIHKNDAKRIVRALEIYHVTGQRPSDVIKKEANTEFRFLSFFLNFEERAKLYEACDLRAEKMMQAGLVEEVKALLSQGLAESPTAAQAIGYKEFADYIRGEATLPETLELIQRRTRNYAKRQITWFSKMDAIPLPAGEERALALAVQHTEDFLKGAPC